MTEPLNRPKRKNPLKKTRLPLAPQGIRSRPRTASPRRPPKAALRCRSARIADRSSIRRAMPARPACRLACPYRDIDPPRHARGRDHGAHLHRSLFPRAHAVAGRHRQARRRADAWSLISMATRSKAAGAPRAKLDRSGAPVVIAMPAREDTPTWQDDPQLRELTCDPKFRRVLITDGRTPSGRPWPRHSRMPARPSSSSASPIRGSRFPAWTRCARMERVEIVPLDLTDTESVTEQAEQNGGRIDIIVNTAEHMRAGGIVERHGLTIAREEMDVRYFGLMRLAQAFGPAMRCRGADGVNSATAFVNFCQSMRWRTGRPTGPIPRPRPRACRQPNACARSCAPAASRC